MTVPLLLVAALLAAAPRAPLAAASTLGRVDFPVSCNPPAQKAFTRGVSALHSFWYVEARAQFQAAAFDEKYYGKELYQRTVREDALDSAALRAVAKSDWATAAARWRELAALRDLSPPPEGADDGGGPYYLVGDALWRAGKPRDAAAAFERSLQQHPGHALSMLALGRASAATGDEAAARRWYARAGEVWSAADLEYAPAKEARAWLAAHPAK